MFRRTFLSALGAVPLLGFLKPKKARGERETYYMLDEASFPERNTGRTQRALKLAIESLAEYQAVCLIVSTLSEADRLYPTVPLVCLEYGLRLPTKHVGGDRWYFGDKVLYIRSASTKGRGMRAHFVLDHSIRDLPSSERRELMQSLVHAHEGPWPVAAWRVT
jgi:hypothetical protein